METLPLPKNVLTFEFKLFGSLTVNQFLRLIGGGILSLALFLSGLPYLITIPLIAFTLGISALSALIPDFGKRLSAYTRYLFRSPQYVWKKDNKVPEALKIQEKKETNSNNNKARKTVSDELDSIDLDRLIASSVNLDKDQSDPFDLAVNESQLSNIDRVYDKEFKDISFKQTEASSNAAPAPTTTPTPRPIQQRKPEEESNDKTVNDLKNSLSKTLDIDEREKIINQIDTKTKEMKSNLSNSAAAKYQEKTEIKKSLYGLVVDTNDTAIQSGSVYLKSMDEQLISQATINSNGKFELTVPSALKTEAIVEIEVKGLKFDRYKISLENANLPIFKFRSK